MINAQRPINVATTTTAMGVATITCGDDDRSECLW